MNLQTLKGFRDFLPKEALKRQWLKNRLVEVFEIWGFDPMETPTLEPLELFEGQIGDDEKLFYKFTDNGGRQVAMRYDQTVPTCRVVGQYNQQLPTPFKRYQIQPAFRAENTQKGRYREFVQCDADIFGSISPLADAEVIGLSLDIYKRLGFKNVKVLINDRSLLKELPYSAISALDKLEKIGKDGVINEMVSKNITLEQANKYFEITTAIRPNESLTTIFQYLESYGFPKAWYEFRPTLARSFSYSTGPIWEVVIPEFSTSSVLGGERFDNLVERISGKKIPGVGFGLGFDRTLEAAEAAGLVPNFATKTKILVTIFNSSLLVESVKLVNLLRSAEVPTELYPNPETKLDRQLKYASQKGIPYVAILGPEELANGKYLIKNLETFQQSNCEISKIPDFILSL